MSIEQLPLELLHTITCRLYLHDYLRLHSASKNLYTKRAPYQFMFGGLLKGETLERVPFDILSNWSSPRIEHRHRILAVACYKGAFELLKRLVREGDVKQRHWKLYGSWVAGRHSGWLRKAIVKHTTAGVSLLQMAALFGHLEICQWLLDLGADWNVETESGFTLLHLAICGKNVNLCRLLMEKGIQHKDANERSSLALALSHGSVEIVQLILDDSSKLSEENMRSMLRETVRYSTIECIQWLFDQPGVMETFRVECLDYWKNACDNRNLNVALYVINRPELSDIKDSLLTTAAIHATQHDRVEQLKFFLDAGANVDGDPQSHSSPLHVACCYQGLACMRLLLERGASLHIGNPKKSNLLNAAVWARCFEKCRLLVERDPNIVEWSCREGRYDGLHKVADFHNLDIAKLLIDHGANVNARDTYGRTPLTNAVRAQNVVLCQYLMDHGARLGDTSAFSAGLQAASRSNNSLIKYLLESGAKIPKVDENTSLHMRMVVERLQALTV
ncbi:ankyrin repeat-containing domain protein [Gorgonomyces haynaldii]|nr:ankyrin repeat-containing domain protein [Gorgonomyces haynaldii]